METEASWTERKGTTIRLTPDEHRQLREAFFKRVEEEKRQGIVNGHL